jgi:hypothetical protein
MLAIVVTLGGYFAGLHWLISPPDPWQPNPKLSQSTTQHVARKRTPPVVRPAEARVDNESMTSTEPDTSLASVETVASAEASKPVPFQTGDIATAQPIERPIVEAVRPTVQPARIVRREVPPTKTNPSNRKRVERNTSRKLELMVLRTYERSDGNRFTRLLPMSSARNVLAFQPELPW